MAPQYKGPPASLPAGLCQNSPGVTCCGRRGLPYRAAGLRYPSRQRPEQRRQQGTTAQQARIRWSSWSLSTISDSSSAIAGQRCWAGFCAAGLCAICGLTRGHRGRDNAPRANTSAFASGDMTVTGSPRGAAEHKAMEKSDGATALRHAPSPTSCSNTSAYDNPLRSCPQRSPNSGQGRAPRASFHLKFETCLSSNIQELPTRILLRPAAASIIRISKEGQRNDALGASSKGAIFAPLHKGASLTTIQEHQECYG